MWSSCLQIPGTLTKMPISRRELMKESTFNCLIHFSYLGINLIYTFCWYHLITIFKNKFKVPFAQVGRLYFMIKREKKGAGRRWLLFIKRTIATTSPFSEDFHQFSACWLITLPRIKKTPKRLKLFHPPTVSKSS